MRRYCKGRPGLLLLAGMVLSLITASAAQAAFPGSNGKIAFDTPITAGPENRIDLINPDATGRAPLTGSPVWDSNPAWSADGMRIVFSRNTGAPDFDNEIWVINADGTGSTQLTSGNDDFEPAFSGDGTKITFSRYDGNDNEVWVMNSNGSSPVQLTVNVDVFDSAPVFSPDSTRIAFDREVMGTGNAIFVMQADGSGQTPLTPTNGDWRAGRPDWSPDGTRLTFWRCDDVIEGCDVPTEIVTIPASGPVVPGTETEVTTNTGNVPYDFDPVYSPDGTRIAFVQEDFSTQTANVFTVPVGGGAEPQLTSADQDRRPDWQPILSSGTAGSKTKNQKKCRGVPVTIRTTNRDDVIKGTPGRDVVHGQRGRDIIKGFKGNDRLCGGRDTDRIYGGPGNDVLFGGHHSDFVFGESGIDKIFGGTPDAPVHRFKDHCSGGGGHDSYRNCQRHKGFDKKFPQP